MDAAIPINDFLIKKKMLIWGSRILIALAFIGTFIGIPIVHADNNNELQVQWVKDITGGILPIITDTINGGGSSGYNSFYTRIAGHTGVIHSAMTALIIVGGAFCVVVAFTHFMQSMERGGDMIENIWKFLLELCIAFFIIMNTTWVITIADNVGQTILSVATAAVTDESSSVSPEEILKKLTGQSTGSTLWQIEALIKLFLPWALSWLVKIAAKFAILQLLFEMGIRYALTPLFIADIYYEGLRSPGMRHIKQYIGVYIKLVVCVLVCALGQELVTSALTGLNSVEGVAICNSLFEVIAINFTCIGVMMKSGEYISAFTQ